MIATAAAIHFAGGIPVPVECGTGPPHRPGCGRAGHHAADEGDHAHPTQWAHLRHGRFNRLPAGTALSMVEDAAQALGSKFKGRCASTFGVAAAISFYPAKVLGCLGDGGAVIANTPRSTIAFQLRDHGRGQDGEIVSWGLNSRLDNIQAAILDFRTEDRTDSVMARRRAVASLYQERLGDVSELVLPPGSGCDPDHFDIYQNYEIEAERRDELRRTSNSAASAR